MKILCNIKQALRYADTQLLELGLAAMMIFLNPLHLWYMGGMESDKAHHAVIIMVAGSIICGVLFLVGVEKKAIKVRHFMARIYWVFTLYCLFSLLRCSQLDYGLVSSFGLQFISALFLIWRLDVELVHRSKRGC